MADTRMFFQLVSQRLLRSDSSVESMGSTMGMVRCRANRRIGFACCLHARIRALAVDSAEYASILVSAFWVAVLDAKVITPAPRDVPFLFSEKMMARDVLDPASVLMNASIVSKTVSRGGSPGSEVNDVTQEMVAPAMAMELTKFCRAVASVKKSGFFDIQSVFCPLTGSMYGMDHRASCIPAMRFERCRSRQLLYLLIIRFPIISLYAKKKNAAAATAA